MRRLSAAVVVTLALPLPAAAAPFADVPAGAWFAVHVDAAASLGIVSGYADAQGRATGRFGPLDGVTVGQALKMAVESAGYDETLFGGAGGHWAQPYLNVLVSTDSSVVRNGDARLDAPATRAQVAQIVADVYHATATDAHWLDPYTDVDAHHPYAVGVAAMTAGDVMVGDGRTAGCLPGPGCAETAFRPDAPISRAEAVKVVMTARARYGAVGTGMTPAAAAMQPDTSADRQMVTHDAAGFRPAVLNGRCGTPVLFFNQSGRMWVASDPHPAHTGTPGFDAGEDMGPTRMYSHTFTSDGDHAYHNHLDPSQTGVIRVTGCR